MATNYVVCINCGIREGTKRCMKCQQAFYCSRDCQVKHWKEEHKKSCTQIETGTKREDTEVKEKQFKASKFPSTEFVVCLSCSEREAKFYCSRCKRQLYCSRECQVEHWRQHKKVCQSKEKQAKSKENKNEKTANVSAEKIRQDLLNSGSASEAQVSQLLTNLKSFYPRFPPHLRKVLDLDIPCFHQEYKEAYPYDKEGFGLLENCFNQQKLWGFQEVGLDEVSWDKYMYVKRYGEHSRALLHMLAKGPRPGDVLNSLSFQSYPEQRYQILRNSAVGETCFEFGKKYVYIGFVDLFELLMGNFSGDGDKVRFVGIEQSEICVARSLIIYEMIKMKASYDAILEVWFSTGWSDKTLELFKAACCNIIPTVQNREVRALIEYWMTVKLQLGEARTMWREGYVSQNSFMPVGNLLRKEDRIAFCWYQFTGQIFGQVNMQNHGNVTMFCRTAPFEEYQLSADTLFASFSLNKFFPYNGNIFESITKYYKYKLDTFIGLVAERKVECTFYVKTVLFNNKEAVKEIKSFKADHVDWNNLADYMSKETFFRLADGCGSKETIHSLHFMNWTRFIYGSFILDYKNRTEVHIAQKKKFMEILIAKHHNGIIPFFRTDIHLNHPYNISSSVLALRYQNKFLDFYFDVDGFKVDITQFNEPDICNCFLRNNHTFDLSFQIEKKQ